jgi:hypothetical protein
MTAFFIQTGSASVGQRQIARKMLDKNRYIVYGHYMNFLPNTSKSLSASDWQNAVYSPPLKLFYIFLIGGIFLFSCKTLETYVENAENEYTAIPLTRKYSLISGEQFTMGDYSLDYKGEESGEVEFFITGETTTRKYNFLKNEAVLYRIEIIKQENQIKSDNSRSAIILGSKRYIRIIDNNRLKKEYAIDTDKKSYLTYQDDTVGAINIRYYQSRNKNDLEHDWLYDTGFNIFVNDTEYGILGFYPLIFYRRNINTEIDSTMYDKIALCTLAAYATYINYLHN